MVTMVRRRRGVAICTLTPIYIQAEGLSRLTRHWIHSDRETWSLYNQHLQWDIESDENDRRKLSIFSRTSSKLRKLPWENLMS